MEKKKKVLWQKNSDNDLSSHQITSERDNDQPAKWEHTALASPQEKMGSGGSGLHAEDSREQTALAHTPPRTGDPAEQTE